METKNAIITSTMLGYEDHGIFTFMIHLNYGGAGQGAGGYALDQYDKKAEKRVGSKYGIDLIATIIKTVGVDSWEQLKGKHIRVKADFGKVYSIGNIITDDWVDFESFWRERK